MLELTDGEILVAISQPQVIRYATIGLDEDLLWTMEAGLLREYRLRRTDVTTL